jgi:hypothetical protein
MQLQYDELRDKQVKITSKHAAGRPAVVETSLNQ